MPKLTKRTVDRLSAPAPGRDVVLWDSELPRFGVRVKPSGHKSYIVQYRIGGRSRRYTLGAHGPMTADKARTKAYAVLGQVAEGADPAGTRATEQATPTVATLADRYLREHAEPHKRPSGVKRDRELLRGRILPALGRYRVTDVTRADVARLHHRMRDVPIRANRTLALLSKMFTLAEAWGLRPDNTNPCRHIKRYRESKRERYLSKAEYHSLGEVLAEAAHTRRESPAVLAAIDLLLYTGMRRGEVLGLRWEDVDLESAWLRLVQTKTEPRTVPLNPEALAVFSRLVATADGSPWVFHGAKPGAPLADLNGPWARIRKRAHIPDVRLHDLRHSWAAMGAGAGHGLPILGRALGHTEAATTQRYAHVADDPVRAMSEDIGRRIAAARRGQQGEVVPMQRRKRRRR